MEAARRDRSRARLEIVFGYSVSALGALIDLISWIAQGNLRFSSRIDVQSFASALGLFAAAAAWWFLTQILVESASPGPVVRRALTCLMLAELFVAVASLSLIGLFQHLQFAWPVAGNTLIGLGALFGAVGFCSMLKTFRDGHVALDALDAPTSN
jgi:hypothetical protein